MKKSLVFTCLVFLTIISSQIVFSNPLPGYFDDGDMVAGNCQTGNYFSVAPNNDTTFTLTMTNNGDIDNNFSISINYIDGFDWLVPDITSGVIPFGQNIQVVFTITAPAGAPDPSAWRADIEITHEAPNDNPRVIPICLGVGLSGPFNEIYDLATACKQLRIFSSGNLGGGVNGASMDYPDDCDTFNVWTDAATYLFDASPIVTYISGTDTLLYTMFMKAPDDEFGFVASAPIVIDDSHESYKMVTTEYLTADSAIGIKGEYFAPKDEDTCEFIIQRLTFTYISIEGLSEIKLGMIIDWNVPSDSGALNGCGGDLTDKLIYQYGAEFNQDDSIEALCGQESNYRYGAISTVSRYIIAYTIDNAIWVDQTGPYGMEAPLPAGPTFQLLKDGWKINLWEPTNPDSQYADLSTLLRFRFGLTAVNIILTGRDGYAALVDDLMKARRFIESHPEILPPSCCILAGNTNSDAAVNVGDAVYIIGYIFKGGVAPPCLEQADANGDEVVNIGDAVYIINWVFKGGPAPVCPVYVW